jgi:hypothetical protein
MKSPTEKTKIISIEANRVFKPNESFGMCDSDIETQYDLYDRVITVRLGTGVPLGTRGTIIGILLGQTHLDTYYEVLFDHLPKNSLDAILLGGNNQQCRIKVRSYHLLNYSHSLRVRSMTNYQQQRSMPGENVWERRLLDQSSTTSRSTQQQPPPPPQPTRILKRTSNDNNSTTTPKSAPAASSTQNKPGFVEMTTVSTEEQQPAKNLLPSTSTEKLPVPQVSTANLSLIPSPKENSLLLPPPVEKLPEPETTFLPANTALPVATEAMAPSTSFHRNPVLDSLFLRAIQESKQIQNPVQQQLNNQPTSVQQQRDTVPPPSLPPMQQKFVDMPTSIQQPWKAIQTPFIPAQQQQQQQHPHDLLSSRQLAREAPPLPSFQNACM